MDGRRFWLGWSPPILFGLYQVLFLLAHNLGQTRVASVLLPAVVVGGGVALAMLVSRPLCADPVRRGLLMSLLVWLFFSYGHLRTGLSVDGAKISHRYLASTMALLFAAAVVAVLRSRRSFDGINRVLALIAGVLVAVTLVRIGVFEGRERDARRAVGTSWTNEPVPHTDIDAAQERPNIYFLVMDRYGSNTSLASVHGIDNGEFTARLRELGFYVADASRSNYLVTRHSLLATLNLEFITVPNELAASADWTLFDERLMDNRVQRFLRARGYRYVQAASMFEWTGVNPHADLNLVYEPGLIHSAFARTLLEQTALVAMRDLAMDFVDLDGMEATMWRYVQYRRLLYKFEAIAAVAKLDGPSFVFAHFILPHDPFVIDRDGAFVTEETAATRSLAENFHEQLLFANRALERLIQALQRDSKISPIIIIQGDEGPYRELRLESGDRHWHEASADELRSKLGVLNALHVPGVDPSDLYPSMSPVNTFRLIFRHYFHADLPPLEDRSFGYEDDDRPWSFYELTEQLGDDTSPRD